MMRAALAPLQLVRARARRRPGFWLLPAFGIALAAAFAVAVAAEGALAGDQAARSTLASLAPAERTVRVTWEGPETAAATERVDAALHSLPLGPQTGVLLLDPVRLSGVVVRPAAIAPLDRWLAPGAARLGPCRPALCRVLLAGPGRAPPVLAAPGVHIRVVGSARLGSPVPLGFAPAGSTSPPVLLTGDVAGLNALTGLSGVFRTSGRVAELNSSQLHGWQLGSVERRLSRAQGAIAEIGSQFSLSGPFAGLDAARAQARAAPRRLLLAGGAAITALALFVVLVGVALRRDQLAELERLRNAGARAGQTATFVAAECGWVALAGLLAGVLLGFVAAAVLVQAGGEPVGGVLMHGVIAWGTAVALAAGWIAATALLAGPVLLRSERVGDALALAAVAALVVALVVNPGGGDALAVLVAPLCCLAAGVLVFRGASWVLRAGERAARRGTPLVRLALVGLARRPGLPSLAIAFVAVSLGLGGFALAYRATLRRGAADEAADRVPLDALLAAGPSFATPLTVAPLTRWRALAGGAVLPVRRTEADYLRGSGTVTIPALGVPAAALDRIHGWRSSDGSAPLGVLARRLQPGGPVRNPGPSLTGARSLSVRASSPALAVSVTADLRAPGGAIRQLVLGIAPRRPAFLHALVPPGRWELEAFELDEPTGLEITNGHQNGENLAPTTQQRVGLTIGPLLISSAIARPPIEVGTGGWLGVGAASSSARSPGATAASVRFETSGTPGIVRPPQPSDTRAVPVLADPQTAAAAGPGGRLPLTVDGLPVRARVAGTVRRFPTLDPAAGGVVVADQATLSSALDAQLPGQGQPDELWISTPHASSLRRALSRMPLAQLSSAFRLEVEHRLSSAPIARAVQRTLLAAAVLWAAVAALGLLTALIGPGRDRSIERDLEAQGLGPRALRLEARARVAVAGALGAAAGIAISLVLTRLAVGSVRAASTVAPPRPPLVTIVPVAQLGAWVAIVVAVLASAGLLATRGIGGAGRTRRATQSVTGPGSELTEGVAR